MKESRILFLEDYLNKIGFKDALRALDLMKSEMCAEKGFKRHDGSHYYYHLVDVTQDLLNQGIRHEPCIVAALLHDWQEDVDYVSPQMIEAQFGSEVALYVDVLSKKPELDYKDEKVLKAYLALIGENVWTALIKVADRKHNFSTLRDATLAKRMKQAIETETYFIPAFKVWRKKFPRYAAHFYEAKTAIEPHLWAIKEYQAEIERLQQALDACQKKGD